MVFLFHRSPLRSLCGQAGSCTVAHHQTDSVRAGNLPRQRVQKQVTRVCSRRSRLPKKASSDLKRRVSRMLDEPGETFILLKRFQLEQSQAHRPSGPTKLMVSSLRRIAYKKVKLIQAFQIHHLRFFSHFLLFEHLLLFSVISALVALSFISTPSHTTRKPHIAVRSLPQTHQHLHSRTQPLSFKMHFKSSTVLAMATIVSQALSHCVLTSIQGSNGVTMPALSVIDGTPRDCAR